MCSFHFKSFWIISPRNLRELNTSNGWSSIIIISPPQLIDHWKGKIEPNLQTKQTRSCSLGLCGRKANYGSGFRIYCILLGRIYSCPEGKSTRGLQGPIRGLSLSPPVRPGDVTEKGWSAAAGEKSYRKGSIKLWSSSRETATSSDCLSSVRSTYAHEVVSLPKFICAWRRAHRAQWSDTFNFSFRNKRYDKRKSEKWQMTDGRDSSVHGWSLH